MSRRPGIYRRELVGAARFELATTCTPCRYATRLRYAPRPVILTLQLVEHRAQFALERGDIDARGRGAAVARQRFELFLASQRVVEPVARAADGEAFLVEQLADAPDEQHLVVLVVAAVAAPLDRLELREFLLPVAQHVRLDAAKLAHLTDGEVALRRDRRELSFPAALLHDAPFRPSPSASGWHER